MTLKEIKDMLEALNFPKKNISDQTAICILALMDKTERKGLLPGHKNLSEGARIHDILNFARNTIGKKVAENTREAYRKTSLAPLMNYGIVVRHQLSTNDPNTYYRLHPEFGRLFAEVKTSERKILAEQLRLQISGHYKQKTKKTFKGKEISVKINERETFSLSAGDHNALEKAVVEIFANAFMDSPQVVYLGDTAPRKGYQNRTLMRKLNLPIDTAASLPDVILCSEPESHLVIVEAVTSSGSVNSMRLEQLHKLTKGPRKLGIKISYVTAFNSRVVFRRFVEEIAWGSSVWIENEPNNIVHFEKLKRSGGA
jgi:hypothetical protein